MDKRVELVGGGSVINGAYPVKFLVNQPTAVLNCTIMEGCIALHCTDMWQVISWHVKCVPPSHLSLRMYVLMSIPPYVHMYFSPSKKFYFGIGTSICIGWEIRCLLNAEIFCIDNISRVILAWPSEIKFKF